jgi:hypothetical protein
MLHASGDRERRDRRSVNGDLGVLNAEIGFVNSEIGMMNAEIGVREQRDRAA